MSTVTNGILSPNTIDLISLAKDGTVELVIVESNRWVGSPEEAALLKNKVGHYCRFFMGGQFAKAYPDMVGRPARIRLFIHHPLNDTTLLRIDDIHSDLIKLGIGWDIKQIEKDDANGLDVTGVGVIPARSFWKKMLDWFLCRKR